MGVCVVCPKSAMTNAESIMPLEPKNVNLSKKKRLNPVIDDCNDIMFAIFKFGVLIFESKEEIGLKCLFITSFSIFICCSSFELFFKQEQPVPI